MRCRVKLISIIVPVYNVEKYLGVCLDSLLPAVKKHDEIFLIQGNSSDSSREISGRYQKAYDCISLLEQDGFGLSNARNCGLRAAHGEYVLFVDSDDFVDTLILSRLLDTFRSGSYRIDVVMTDFYRYYETNKKERYMKQIGQRTLKGLEALPLVITGRQCFWNVWRNLYRRTFLLENQIFFKENTYGEDIDYITRVLLADPEIVFINAHFYRYRIDRKGSLMDSASVSRVRETISVLEENICRLRSSKESWCSVVIHGYQFEYFLNLALIQELPLERREEAYQLFQAYRQILLPTEDRLVKLLAWWISLIGIPKMSRILSFAKCMKRKREHRAS